jgi:hypothetical protein
VPRICINFQCCGSGMFIPDPNFHPSRIQKQQQKRGVKKILCHTFLCSHKFHKIVHYFSFEVLKKKIWANFQRIIELFTQKIVTKLSKVWVWDPGSEIRKKSIPDPGSMGQKFPIQIQVSIFKINFERIKKRLFPATDIYQLPVPVHMILD